VKTDQLQLPITAAKYKQPSLLHLSLMSVRWLSKLSKI
jgi:hypothetical protein